ncbi:MAG: acetoacetate--CoA ligase [Thiolinea sp.]
MNNVTNQPLWQPSPESIPKTLIHQFMQQASATSGNDLMNFDALHAWSVQEKEAFWSQLWDFAGVVGDRGERALVNGDQIEQAQWFPDASLNFAENLLQARPEDDVVMHFRAEDQVAYDLTYGELYDQVARTAQWLRNTGVGAGDRVAAYVPNMPETVVVMLAATSLGAIWTSTSPDFGHESVIERFGQTEPKILFAVDGYYYNGKQQDIRGKVKAVAAELPSVEQVVIFPLLGLDDDLPGIPWREILATERPEKIEFVRRGFNDPLYILYSSGTTGKPKCITHKIGGVLLKHLCEHQLHSDIRPGDKVFYFSTCGWMMWNWLVTALASKAALVLYDGSPFHPGPEVLWDYAESIGMTLFGTSAKYIEALKNADYRPVKHHDLSQLRTLCSTGSVLAPECFDYVYDAVKQDLCLSSVSGGTDIVGCFVLGCPVLPVYRGACQALALGLATNVFNDEGQPVREEKGELVCMETFPSQPAFFWGDDSGEKYHNAYFATYENVWHHGDYVELTPQNGMIIYGRSDATLNPGGVRIGTAEIYRHVEQLDQVVESIVIGQDWENDVRVVLFVVLQDGVTLDDELSTLIKQTVRRKCTPRHTPAKVIQVAEIPRTKSGKIVELAVREIVHGRPVKNVHALANAEALELYRDLEELQS